MLRICAPLSVVALLAAAAPLAAEETPGAAPVVAIVTGLADGDLLNIRASASPVGTVKGRLPNGTTLTNYGCGEINGYKWCKVEDAADPKLNGWTPARYLFSNPGDVAPQLPPEAASATPAATDASGAGPMPTAPSAAAQVVATLPPAPAVADLPSTAAPVAVTAAEPATPPAAAPAPVASPAADADVPAVAAGTPLPPVEPAPEAQTASSGPAKPLTSEAIAAMVANRAPVAETQPEQVAMAAPASEPAKPFEIGSTAAAKADKPGVAAEKAVAQPTVPPDLTARLGGDAGTASSPADQQAAAAAIGKTAIADAYGLAFAARDKAAAERAGAKPTDVAPEPTIESDAAPTPEVTIASVEATPAPVSVDAAPPPAGDVAPPVAAAAPADAQVDPLTPVAVVPLPSPRPEIAGEPVLDTQTVAQVQAPPPEVPAPAVVAVPASVEPASAAPALAGAASAVTAEIPCARYLGQPMTRCQVRIARKGDTIADVTVTWPDGGTRVISFYGGEPAGSNSRSAFRFTREGELNMIRVGPAERFEITDSVAFGD